MMKQALYFDDMNVIVVDWSNGINTTEWKITHTVINLRPFTGWGEYYNHAVANIKLIGVMIAHMILLLNVSKNFSSLSFPNKKL